MFEISLAEWSLHRALFDKQLDNLDFAKVAKQDYGIEAIEFVNQFFKDKPKDKSYLAELKKRADDLGVKMLLIMIDGQRDAIELSVYVRPGELESTIALLVAEGFIESAGDGGGAVRAPAANDPVVFAEIKIRAMTEIRAKLGVDADRLISEINNCSTPLVLREKLRRLENLLVHLMGSTEGVSFARRVGRMAA